MPNWVQITNDNRQTVLGWIQKATPGISVAFKRPNRRTRDQNDLLWPYLRKIAKEVTWSGNKFDEHAWKDIFVNSLWGNMSVPGIHGGIVFVGNRHSTSALTKAEMSELLEMIVAFCAEHEISLDD